MLRPYPGQTVRIHCPRRTFHRAIGTVAFADPKSPVVLVNVATPKGTRQPVVKRENLRRVVSSR